MASPLAWQGDGPPRPLTPSLSAQYSDQFDTSHSLASLTFIAAQLSTLLNTIAIASSSYARPPLTLNPTPITPTPPSLNAVSPTLLPLSNSLTLCHSNLVSALSSVLSTSFQLLTLSAPLTAPTSLPLHSTAPRTTSHHPSSPSTNTPRTITIPPRFTIRLVSDLEPVTPSHSTSNSRPHTPTPTPTSIPVVVAGVSNETGASNTVANNSFIQARFGSSAPITPVIGSTPLPTPSPPLSPSITTATTTSPAPSPSPPQPSSSSSSPPSSPPSLVVIGACEVKEQSSSVATNSLYNARLDSFPSPSCAYDNASHTHSPPTNLTTISTTATTATTNTITPPSHPSTRSTGTAIHPFFIDLHSRTGKQAKHFRRLYPPAVGVCECGLFPRYSEQVRSAESPAVVLPEPLRPLCLDCIWQVVQQYQDDMKDARTDLKKPAWQATHVRGLVDLDGDIWNNSMIDTYNTHYNTYYTAAHKQAVAALAPSAHYDAAIRWTRQLQRQSHQQRQRWYEVLEVIKRRGKEMEEKEEAVVGAKREEEEEDEKVEEQVRAVVGMEGGKQVAQS